LNLVSNIKNKISIRTIAEYSRTRYVCGVGAGFAGELDLVATVQSMCVGGIYFIDIIYWINILK
jgi:hypothetical protein